MEFNKAIEALSEPVRLAAVSHRRRGFTLGVGRHSGDHAYGGDSKGRHGGIHFSGDLFAIDQNDSNSGAAE